MICVASRVRGRERDRRVRRRGRVLVAVGVNAGSGGVPVPVSSFPLLFVGSGFSMSTHGVDLVFGSAGVFDRGLVELAVAGVPASDPLTVRTERGLALHTARSGPLSTSLKYRSTVTGGTGPFVRTTRGVGSPSTAGIGTTAASDAPRCHALQCGLSIAPCCHSSRTAATASSIPGASKTSLPRYAFAPAV